MAYRNIVELMQVSEEVRDLAWLQESLVNAVQLELATLPPYLCAYWSITPQSDQTAANLISNIFLQEMKHMGLAANMLVGVGGTPEINTAVPTYPGPLPGGVRPELTVYLAGLTKDYVKNVCMEIETPENPVPMEAVTTFTTIGAFYDAVAQAFVALQPTITTTNQQTASVGGAPGVIVINSVDEAVAAITIIKVEGEGTSTSPDEAPNDPAHYYKFGSIYYGATIIEKDGKFVYEGTPVPWPSTYPMAQVPAGGWTGQPNLPANVQQLLGTFNSTYKSVLDNLQGAWTGAGTLSDAISDMFGLQGPAQQLMQIAIGGGTAGNYGPDFIA